MHFPYERLRGADALSNDDAYIFSLSIPDRGSSWVGTGCRRAVVWSRDAMTVKGEGGGAVLPRPSSFPEALARQLPYLDTSFPCYVLVSPDLARDVCDPEIPLAVFLQPEQETCETSNPVEPGAPGSGVQFRNEADCGWSGESDEVFLSRLREAVGHLQGIDGKMILTRQYALDLRPDLDPLRLYEIYSGLEAGAAAVHYFCAPEFGVSIGCSPENIFEIEQGRLTFDVVASTRGVHPDPVIDARWADELVGNPKEIKEHRMALDRYRARMDACCVPGSVEVDLLMGIRKLRHVRHLHSRLSGQVRDGVDSLRLLGEGFPPLTSYPSELIPLADSGRTPARFYGGVVGRLAPGLKEGVLYLNLRSLLVHGRTLHTQGGVGVIAESIPEQELLEVENKLRCLKEAVALWMREADARKSA